MHFRRALYRPVVRWCRRWWRPTSLCGRSGARRVRHSLETKGTEGSDRFRQCHVAWYVAVAVGGLLKMLNDVLGVRFDPFPLLPDFLAIIGGGVALGVRRRVFFIRAFEYPREAADLDLLARMLATSASIACYTALWVVAVAAGNFLAWYVASQIVALGISFGRRKLKDGRLRTLVNAVWPPVFVGTLNSFLNTLGATPAVFPLMWLLLSIFVGGVTLGVIRRQFFFARVFANTVVKVIAVPLVVVSVVYIAALGAWTLGVGFLIPVELVTPSTVAEGWTATTPLNFAGKRARYRGCPVRC